jgi:superfamily I DNA/RNA helicase
MRDRRQAGWKTDAQAVRGLHRPAPAAWHFSLAELDIDDVAGLLAGRRLPYVGATRARATLYICPREIGRAVTI